MSHLGIRVLLALTVILWSLSLVTTSSLSNPSPSAWKTWIRSIGTRKAASSNPLTTTANPEEPTSSTLTDVPPDVLQQLSQHLDAQTYTNLRGSSAFLSAMFPLPDFGLYIQPLLRTLYESNVPIDAKRRKRLEKLSSSTSPSSSPYLSTSSPFVILRTIVKIIAQAEESLFKQFQVQFHTRWWRGYRGVAMVNKKKLGHPLPDAADLNPLNQVRIHPPWSDACHDSSR